MRGSNNVDRAEDFHLQMNRAIVRLRDCLIRQIQLESGTDDLINELGDVQVVSVRVEDVDGQFTSFTFLESDAVPYLVNESDSKDYMPAYREVLGVIDNCTPKRIVSTVNSYLLQQKQASRTKDD